MTLKRLPVDEPFAAAAPAIPEPSAKVRLASEPGSRRAPDRNLHRALHRARNSEDGTRQLLISGAWTMLVGLLAGMLAATVFGGVGRQGAHSNPGWLLLIVAMMSTPFAILLLLLGGAKWLRNRGLSRNAPEDQRG